MTRPIRLLQDHDVLSTSSSALMFQCTFKVSEFLTIMQSKLEEELLLGEGLECELLSPGQQWQKGKIKLRIEFEPDVVDEVPGTSHNSATPATSFNGSDSKADSQIPMTSALESEIAIPPVWQEQNAVAPQPLPVGNMASVGMWS